MFATVLSIESRINACSISPSRGFFFYLQRRKLIFFWHTTWYINVEYLSHVWCCMNIYIRNNPLTWSGGSLYLAANLCPCWPHVRSQLPQFWSPCPIPVALIFPFLSTHVNTMNTDYINTPKSSTLGHNLSSYFFT